MRSFKRFRYLRATIISVFIVIAASVIFAAGDNWDLAGLRPNAFSRCRDYWSRPDEKNRDDHGSTIVESLKASHRGLPPLIN